MEKSFIEMKLFQVRPDKLEQFEALIRGYPRINLSAKAVYRSSISRGSSPSTESNSVSHREN